MKQSELTARFTARPQNFAWFLGAGSSRSSGLPTATDVILDMKRRYYCREENQEISRQDIQSQAVKDRIQAFMDSRGFPALWADDEYTAYFEKIFGHDKERQRKYINAILSEDKVTLSVGNRVLGALMSTGLCRIVFTTNFDSVVEKAVAEVSGNSLMAYHLEGAHTARQALDNEEFPIYCKLHGDFRYDSIKNLSSDLAQQNEELSSCLVNAGNRFGFIIAGYSGRDESVMQLFHRVLDTPNPFPHGLFWTGIKGASIHPAVSLLLESARSKGVDAHYVEIETFDTMMLRLWRNVEPKSPGLDAKVRKSRIMDVNIELPSTGSNNPVLRFNALPLLSAPDKCLSLSFREPKDWIEMRGAMRDSRQSLVLTKSGTIWCWGTEKTASRFLGSDHLPIEIRDVPLNVKLPENLHVKRFIEEALCLALSRGRPLLSRTDRGVAYLIVDSHAESNTELAPLSNAIGKPFGKVPGLAIPSKPGQPEPRQVEWAEALRISIDYRNGQLWILIDPDIWIWPPYARKEAANFLQDRRRGRRNDKYNVLLDAWITILFRSDQFDAEINVTAFAEGSPVENPAFRIGRRTAFSRKL